tara:strand:+ start:3776 stop:6019 length:2244 start_codon:yes stop_codon:yes gene_type:complete
MGKFFSRFFLLLLISIISLIIYLSYFGISTDKFDDIIKNRANEVNRYIKLEFQKTKIHLNLKELNLVVRLQNPKVIVKDSEIDLSKLNLLLSLDSFFSTNFLLERAEVAFKENDIKDLTKITRIFLPRIINNQLNKIFIKGNLEGEFIIPFESDGKISKDYGFSGKISDATINLTKDFSIKNLTTEIKNINNKDEEVNAIEFIIKNGFIYDLNLSNSKINLKREENQIKVKNFLQTNGKLNFSQIQKISSLFNLSLDNFKDIHGTADLKTDINFDLDKGFKIKNLSYSVEGNISHIEMHTTEKRVIKKYLPEFDPKITLKNTNIKLINSKSNNILDIDGLIKVGKNFDSFKIKEIYNFDKNNIQVNGNINLTNSKVQIPRLNYNKQKGEKSEVNFDINLSLNKYYNINNLNFLADKNKIYLSEVKLNKNFELIDFKNIEVKTFSNKIINNDFSIKKEKKIIISGSVFDAEPLLKSLYKKSDKKTFSKNFSSDVKINFNKVLTGTDDDISDFAMIASIYKSSYIKLSSKGIFSENEIVEMSIYKVNDEKKTLQVVSDRARPFIKNFDFIKGFEGGKLEYESTITKNDSTSNLIITDFKVSKVPALAKLLTLASLQGIADTLSGEGIRFESFEMKSKTEGNVLNIEDALAMGPAVSILLEGYVDKGKIVSLRGTLVPATKLNSIIASIPLVGDILVGKKTGEGVVGVSFKMKGPPKDIKTTVNPIKTLTPRFIVRAVEKMKNKKKEETK